MTQASQATSTKQDSRPDLARGPAGSPDFGPGVDVAAYSCAGARGGGENQDNFVLIGGDGRAVFMLGQRRHEALITDWPAGQVRLAVLDGMGGHGHGRQAAEAAAAGLLRIPACGSQEELNTRLDGLHATLQTFFDELDPGKTSMRPGTTLTLLELRPGLPPLLYHVGDSRLYEIADGSAQALTVDHVPATGFAMRDLLGEAEWRQQVHGEHRSQIAQAFILGNAFSDPNRLSDELCALDEHNLPAYLRHMPDRRALEVRSDAVYVLASDGFWACTNPAAWIAEWPALLNAQSMGAAIGGQQPSAAALLQTLFERFIHSPPAGMHVDNLTAIVLRFHQDDSGENIDETALPTLPIGPQM